MNVSLLAKWRWRLLDGKAALWKDVLQAKYGNRVGRLLEGGVELGRISLLFGGRS